MMKHTYIINITSTDTDRNEFLRSEGLNTLNVRFYCRDEAERFCRSLNETESFLFYKETAHITREI